MVFVLVFLSVMCVDLILRSLKFFMKTAFSRTALFSTVATSQVAI